MTVNFYPGTATGITSLYSSTAARSSEPNMREELINTLDGSSQEVAKGQPGILRIMNRDSNNNLVPCGCVDEITNEPDKDRFCPICFGMGYLWAEEHVVFYRILQDSNTDNSLKEKLREQGLINVPIIVFYIRYSALITKEDRVVRLELDDDGSASSPLKRLGIYRINGLWDYRADNGKLEYWKVFTHHEDVKYLNAPSRSDL